MSCAGIQEFGKLQDRIMYCKNKKKYEIWNEICIYSSLDSKF